MLQIAPFDKSINSTIMEFQGKVTWARLVDLNKWGKWSLNLYPDNESLEKLRELQAEGVKNVIKKDDEGYYLQISRPAQVEFKKGQVQSVTPPHVRDSNKQPIPNNIRIGDGSDCKIAVEVYSHKVPNSERRAKAMRLYGVEVINLVPSDYTPPEETEVEQPW